MSAVFIEEGLSGLDLEVSPFLPSPSSTAYLPPMGLLFSSGLSASSSLTPQL